MIAINNLYQSVTDGARQGYYAGVRTSLEVMALSYGSLAVSYLTGTGLQQPSAYATGVITLTGTVVGAGAGLIGANPARPARIASEVAALYCALPFRDERILSQVGTIVRPIQSALRNYQWGSLASTVGGGFWNRARLIARR
jgi:hypothetical protein